MATRIVLTDHTTLTVTTDLATVREHFSEAAANGGWVQIEPDGAPKVAVSPTQVLYLEEVSPAEFEAEETGTVATPHPSEPVVRT